MPGLGPEAAAAAWLARIPEAQQRAAAIATHHAAVLWLLTAAVLVIAPLIVLRLGLMERLRGVLEREGPRPWLASALLALVLAVILLAATAPLALAGGVSAGDLWRKDLALALGAVIVVPLVLAVARAAPRTGWLGCGAAAAALVFAYTWLPYALAGGPGAASAPSGPLKASLLAMAGQAHVPVSDISLSAARDFDGDVTGGFGRAVITVSRGALDAPPAETQAYIAHVMGHFVHGDVLTIALVLAAIVLAAALAVQVLFAPLAALLRATARHPSDPAGLPVAAVIVTVVLGLGGLAEAAVIRAVNVRADAFALDLARAPDGLAAVLIRTWDGKAVAPSPLEEALFYTHPPLTSRIRHAMAWKALQEDRPRRQ